jgi:hypothetical protein
VIESLKANTLSEKINPVFDNKIENIIFIKSYNASNVKSIALNPIGNILLNRLNQAQNLLEWKNIVMEELGISQNICIQFIKKMIQSDVVSIIKN